MVKTSAQSGPDLDEREEDGKPKGLGKPIKRPGVTDGKLRELAETYLKEKLDDPDYEAPPSIR